MHPTVRATPPPESASFEVCIKHLARQMHATVNAPSKSAANFLASLVSPPFSAKSNKRLICCCFQSLDADSEPLTTWICKQLSMGRGRGQSVRGAVQALCVLLRNDTARTSFGRLGGVAYLTKIIRMQVRIRFRPRVF